MRRDVITDLKELRLRGMANALEDSLTALSQKKLAPTRWLEQLLQAEASMQIGGAPGVHHPDESEAGAAAPELGRHRPLQRREASVVEGLVRRRTVDARRRPRRRVHHHADASGDAQNAHVRLQTAPATNVAAAASATAAPTPGPRPDNIAPRDEFRDL